MMSMFYGCSSLSSLPDISNWNTNNVTNMWGIFCGCSSLSFLPDISKWSTNKVKDMRYMFRGCSSLSSLSGNDSKEEQLLNISEISLAFDIFHFDISGKYFREEHS